MLTGLHELHRLQFLSSWNMKLGRLMQNMLLERPIQGLRREESASLGTDLHQVCILLILYVAKGTNNTLIARRFSSSLDAAMILYYTP